MSLNVRFSSNSNSNKPEVTVPAPLTNKPTDISSLGTIPNPYNANKVDIPAGGNDKYKVAVITPDGKSIDVNPNGTPAQLPANSNIAASGWKIQATST